jgi:cytoskeletal protein RodZ
MNANAKKTIGQQIAAARLAKGWTLDEAARRTNLKPALLARLEADEFDRLPSVSNARGFIRLYARELGLDGWALLKQFNGTAEVPVDMLDLEPEDLEAIPQRSHEPVATSQGLGLLLLVAVILVAIGVGGYKLYTVRPFITKPDQREVAAEPPRPAPAQPTVAKKNPEAPLAKPAGRAEPPVAKPVENSPAKPPAAPVASASAEAVEPAPPLAKPAAATAVAGKGLRLQLVADADAGEAERWVRVFAIVNGRQESIYADFLPAGKPFPADEPWTADGFVVVMSEASVIGIIQNGGAPQKYELPGNQRVKLPVN